MNNISHNEIGQVTATFQTDGTLKPGNVCTMGSNHTVTLPVEDNDFIGVVLTLDKDNAATVLLHGYVECHYTYDAPALGWSVLSADYEGGVCTNADGKRFVVVYVDEATGTVGFYL